MKKYLMTALLLFHVVNVFGQLILSKATRVGDVMYNVFDSYTGEAISLRKVTKFYDGSEMNAAKCDNVIYINYGKDFFQRVYGDNVDIRWFGCNEKRNDNQVIINKILQKYKTATIPAGIFEISGGITVPEYATLKGNGRNCIIKLKAPLPVDGISVFRGAVIKNFTLDCTETSLDLKSAIIINPWQKNSFTGQEILLENLNLLGNYPHLQGVGLKLQILKNENNLSLIAFCKFLNINIYGFRDGIFCDLDYFGGNKISYINANTFDNIIIYNCLRPLQLINTGKKEDVLAGKATIMSNFFSNIIVQHVVGKYPAFYLDGAEYNNFTAQIIDWPVPYFEETKKGRNNTFNSLPFDGNKK
ncbi:hypothetical protein GCM10022289_24070 [Pedobacter jeongneungensis]|uniref:Uncharacterized protein n=1 Tax=Pedobacter jeongneungensis TaxID=947309 RepID=A0ABP8BET1_9SPHI